MSTYITVYVLFSILVLFILNFSMVKHKKRRLVNEVTKDKVKANIKQDSMKETHKEDSITKAEVKTKEELKIPRRSKGNKDSEQDHGKMKILAALMLGAFVAILNQTLLNVAIPHIMTDLNVSATTVQWLSTGYMLVNGICIPITAYLIEKFGTRKLFIFSVFLFTFGSVFALSQQISAC
jgi:hypothetical protein